MPPRIEKNIHKRRQVAMIHEGTSKPPDQHQRRTLERVIETPLPEFSALSISTSDPLALELNSVCHRMREAVMNDRDKASNITVKDQIRYIAMIALAAERRAHEIGRLTKELDASRDTTTQFVQALERSNIHLDQLMNETSNQQAEIQRLQAQWEDKVLLKEKYEATLDFQLLAFKLWGYGFDFACSEIQKAHPDWDIEFVKKIAYQSGVESSGIEAGPSGVAGEGNASHPHNMGGD